MIPYQGSPTIYRHQDPKKLIYLTVHVDDVLLVCNEEDTEWFLDCIKTLTVKRDGPHAQGSNSKVYYLKKQITLCEDGILVQPSALGLILYIAQDRPDIQFAVKVLSTYMTSPSINAMSAMKHLASYLDRTRSDGILMRKSSTLRHHLDSLERFRESTRKKRSCKIQR